MNPPTLFDVGEPMVRHQDPVTSRIAAKRVDVGAGQRKVLAALTDLITGTDEQIERHPACEGMGTGSARKRRLELQRAGLIELAGYTSAPRRMQVWRAA